MKLIFTSYQSVPEYDRPERWLDRINAYTGILETLAARHEVIGIERIGYEGRHEHNGVLYYFIRQSEKVSRFPFRMHRLIKKLQPDVVFVNGFIFPLQIIQLRLALGASVKIIVLHRSEKPFTGIRKYFQRMADRCIDAYLFASLEFRKQWTANGNIKNAQKIHEVMHGSSRFHPGDRRAAQAALSITASPVFLWVGRLDDNKDPLTVVEGFLQFLSYRPGATLYLVYQTEELLGQIKDLVTRNNAGHSIHLIGKVAHAELETWYNGADFILSGSHYEGGGFSACEAMSCGCIPILTDIIAFRATTGNGRCGLLYEPGNVQELLHALLATRDMDLEKERARVLQQFRDELSFEAISQKIDRIIVSLNTTRAADPTT